MKLQHLQKCLGPLVHSAKQSSGCRLCFQPSYPASEKHVSSITLFIAAPQRFEKLTTGFPTRVTIRCVPQTRLEDHITDIGDSGKYLEMPVTGAVVSRFPESVCYDELLVEETVSRV
jgi:hypothetical protein